jgi:hypothetical protein
MSEDSDRFQYWEQLMARTAPDKTRQIAATDKQIDRSAYEL